MKTVGLLVFAAGRSDLAAVLAQLAGDTQNTGPQEPATSFRAKPATPAAAKPGRHEQRKDQVGRESSGFAAGSSAPSKK